MGQKVNPIGFRLGIVKGWDSNWYGGKSFSDKLVEDQKIRKYIDARIPKGGISKIVIERTLKRITLTIHTARPGVVIGKGGMEVDKIKDPQKKRWLSERSMSRSASFTPILERPSNTAHVANATHAPQVPWSLTEVTQSCPW